MRLRIRAYVDSMPPFDGERYWRWEVVRDVDGESPIIFAMGWGRTKANALQLARFVRQEITRW